MGANTGIYQAPSFHSSCQNLVGKKTHQDFRNQVLATLTYCQCIVWFYDMSGYLAWGTSKVATPLTRGASGKTQIIYVIFLFHTGTAFRSGCASAAMQAPLPRTWSYTVFIFINSFILSFWTIPDFNTHRVQREFKLAAYTRRAEIFGFYFRGIVASSQSG